ncbi:MAG: hypothetical protein AB7F59_05260 [Bdellovibrionales bacterium]
MTFLLGLVLSAMTAQAMPTIGDTAQYNYTIGAQKVAVTQKITAFNSGANTYNILISANVNGRVINQNQSIEADKLITDAQVDAILADCAGNGGTPMMVTVPAGTYQTCKLVQNDESGQPQTIYIADNVAFGYVKANGTAQGQTYMIDLVSSQMGR